MDIVKASVAKASTESTTLIGEDTDLLILLLYHGKIDNKELYFRSDKERAHVYNINVLKNMLDACTHL